MSVYELPEATREVRRRVAVFMDEHIYPNEALLAREDAAADALMKELQERVKAAGRGATARAFCPMPMSMNC